MKPVCGKRCASATRCSPPPKPISSRTASTGGSNSSAADRQARMLRCRAQDAAAGARSGRPDAHAACGPCGGRRTSRAPAAWRRHGLASRLVRSPEAALIAASDRADRAAAPVARSRRCRAARNGYARPCRRRRGRRGWRYGRGEIAVGAAAGEGVDQLEADLGGERLGVLEQRGARIALLVRRPVQARPSP